MADLQVRIEWQKRGAMSNVRRVSAPISNMFRSTDRNHARRRAPPAYYFGPIIALIVLAGSNGSTSGYGRNPHSATAADRTASGEFEPTFAPFVTSTMRELLLKPAPVARWNTDISFRYPELSRRGPQTETGFELLNLSEKIPVSNRHNYDQRQHCQFHQTLRRIYQFLVHGLHGTTHLCGVKRKWLLAVTRCQASQVLSG